MDPAANSAKAKKRNDDPPPPAKRVGTSGQNTIEYRIDYVCSFLNIKKENIKD
jgi:hypothetical protein